MDCSLSSRLTAQASLVLVLAFGGCASPSQEPTEDAGDPVEEDVRCLEPLDDGGPIELAVGVGPTHLAVNDDYVYWTNFIGGTVMRVPRCGGDAEVIADGAAFFGIDVVGDHLLWTDDGTGLGGRLLQARTDGSERVVLVEGLFEPGVLVADDADVYFASGRTGGTGSLRRWDRAQGAMRTVQDSIAQPKSIALDDQHVYFNGNFSVFRAGRAGDSPVEELATNQAFPNGVSLGGGGVVFTEQGTPGSGNGAVKFLEVGGSGVMTLATNEHIPVATEVHDGFVYWVTMGSAGLASTDGTLARSALDGSVVEEVLLSGLRRPRDLAVHDGVLYFLTQGTQGAGYEDGRVYALPLNL